jgi:two-component system cell cycle sensor histidine kinase/response regulator CckA
LTTKPSSQRPASGENPQSLWGAIFEHASWGIRIGSADGSRVLAVNSTFAAMHGYTVDELSQRPIEDLYPPEHAREALTRLGRVADQGRQVFESVHRRSDGSRFPVLVDATVFSGPDGELYQAVNVLDLSDFKRAESARLEMEARYRVVAEAASDAIVTIDTESRILFANPAVERVFGYAPREVVGQRLTMLMPEYLRRVHEAGLARYLSTGIRHLHWEAVEVPGLHREGHEIPLEVSFGEFIEARRKVFTGVIRDVGARKLTEERLREVQRMETVGRLAGGIAHEVNNQLSVILGTIEFLSHRSDLSKEVKQEIDQLRQAAERSTEIISQLLAFGRRQLLRPEVVPINDIIEGCEPVMRRAAGAGIRLQLNLSPAAGDVKVDRAQIQQVLLNLVLNAVHAMDGKGVLQVQTDRITVTEADVHAKPAANPKAGSYALVRIRDTGHGMNRVTLGRIFEPFFTTKKVGEGTGLGLSTAYGIIRQSGGDLWAESEPEAGTTMTIRLLAVDPLRA